MNVYNKYSNIWPLRSKHFFSRFLKYPITLFIYSALILKQFLSIRSFVSFARIQVSIHSPFLRKVRKKMWKGFKSGFKNLTHFSSQVDVKYVYLRMARALQAGAPSGWCYSYFRWFRVSDGTSRSKSGNVNSRKYGYRLAFKVLWGKKYGSIRHVLRIPHHTLMHLTWLFVFLVRCGFSVARLL